jgi:mannosyl-3-phosphoglycerate phosphatase
MQTKGRCLDRAIDSPAIIFTDLDGTLLDQDSYSYKPARPALEALRAQGIPVVFCTSKTRAEVEEIRRELNNSEPFVVENGGAIFIPVDYFPFPVPAAEAKGPYHVIELGAEYQQVVATLCRASRASACPVFGFHEMSVAEIARRCRMSLQAAARAKQREYDEPFDILTDNPTAVSSLFERLEEEGLTWTRGGRFYHLRGHHNKGNAAQILTELFRRQRPETITVGLGDGPNDISLLEVVDVPVIIPARHDYSLDERPPLGRSMSVAQHAGPRGWNQAVLKLLATEPRP